MNLIVLLPFILSSLQLKQVAKTRGLVYDVDGYILCADTDHDSLNELIFHTFRTVRPSGVNYIMIWEYRPVNRYELVYVDSIYFPGNPPPGIHTALFASKDVGDLDDDGLTDILGVNTEHTNKGCEIVCVHESKAPFSHPDTMVWFRYTGNNGINIDPRITDLDQDGRKEITYAFDSLRILECRGNNQYEKVFSL